MKILSLLLALSLSGCITNQSEIVGALKRCEKAANESCSMVAVPDSKFDELLLLSKEWFE